MFSTLLPHLDNTDYVHPVIICHILFRRQGQSSENMRSLSLAQQLATHYRVTFAKSPALIRLSTIYFLYVLIITLYKGLANPVWFYVVRYVLCQVCNRLADS